MTVVQVPIPRDTATSAHVALKVQPAASPNRVSTLEITDQHPTSTQEKDHARNNNYRTTRQPRKPSPGLAARLKALGFGKDSNRRESSANPGESIGRIPEDHIRQLDLVHRSNSINSPVQRRGRAWSGSNSSKLPPQIVGDSSRGFSIEVPSSPVDSTPTAFLDNDIRILEVRARRRSSTVSIGVSPVENHGQADMDQQKYRLPDHVNGNGTKSILEVRKAHIERDSTLEDYDDSPPPPPPISKDEPLDQTAPGAFTNEVQSYFNPFGLQRAGSVYTLSRVSFASQLAQLTSLQLPDAESLSSRVSSIPTSQAAARALTGAADQIRSWISKASEVLGGLDADDDVEWAAAGGREGLAEVDNAISRFEELINVYVSSIEELQGRNDIADVPSEELKTVVTQVETILKEWEMVRNTLTDVKSQVEIAMEWEELWNVVLGDIGNEMDELSRLVFEMEEKRHKSLTAEPGGEGVDLGELETIVEETPQSSNRLHVKNRFSITATFPMSPHSPHTPTMAQDDSSLLALFARMQPLRASLDFLPMRLSTFHARADETFPTACAELESRRDGLENSWKHLEKDAESLRRELGEDRWVLVFRGAGRQAQKLYESVERSLVKLQEAIDSDSHLNNPSLLGKKIENYETKKLHYGPAIERVLAIIEKGVKDRLTVNGEVVRLHSDMQSKWDNFKCRMADLDTAVEELQADKRNQQLRDSISTLMSNDRSTVGSVNDTPGSSPASSVIMSTLHGGVEDHSTTPVKNGKVRAGNHPPPHAVSRHVSTPSTGSSHIPRRGSNARLSSYGTPGSITSPSPGSRGGSATPTGSRLPRPKEDKPRWNSSVRTSDGLTGHNFKPLSLTTPSPHARPSPNLTHSTRSLPAANALSSSKISLRSPLGADTFSSTTSGSTTPSKAPGPSSRLPYQTRITSPGPYSQQVLSSPLNRPRQLHTQASTPNLASRRASLQPPSSKTSNPTRPGMPGSGTDTAGRPASSLAASRRTSMLPQPHVRGRPDSSVTGRESPQAVAGAALAMRRGSSQTSTDSKGKEKTRWR